MATEQEIQLTIDSIGTAAAEQTARLRVLIQQLQELPSHHAVYFSDGEILSTNVLHDAASLEQLLKRLSPYVARWQ